MDTVPTLEDLTTLHFERIYGTPCFWVRDYLEANGVVEPQVLKMNAWKGDPLNPGVWAITVLNEHADQLQGLMDNLPPYKGPGQ